MLMAKVFGIQELKLLEIQMAKANEIEFIEREAVERLDLAGEGDLIFVFSEDAVE